MSNVTKTDAEAFCSGVMDYCSQHGYGPETVELMLKRAAEMVPDLSEELEKAGQGVYNAPFIPSDRAQAQQRREDQQAELNTHNRYESDLAAGRFRDSRTGKPHFPPQELIKRERDREFERGLENWTPKPPPSTNPRVIDAGPPLRIPPRQTFTDFDEKYRFSPTAGTPLSPRNTDEGVVWGDWHWLPQEQQWRQKNLKDYVGEVLPEGPDPGSAWDWALDTVFAPIGNTFTGAVGTVGAAGSAAGAVVSGTGYGVSKAWDWLNSRSPSAMTDAWEAAAKQFGRSFKASAQDMAGAVPGSEPLGLTPKPYYLRGGLAPFFNYPDSVEDYAASQLSRETNRISAMYQNTNIGSDFTFSSRLLGPVSAANFSLGVGEFLSPVVAGKLAPMSRIMRATGRYGKGFTRGPSAIPQQLRTPPSQFMMRTPPKLQPGSNLNKFFRNLERWGNEGIRIPYVTAGSFGGYGTAGVRSVEGYGWKNIGRNPFTRRAYGPDVLGPQRVGALSPRRWKNTLLTRSGLKELGGHVPGQYVMGEHGLNTAYGGQSAAEAGKRMIPNALIGLNNIPRWQGAGTAGITMFHDPLRDNNVNWQPETVQADHIQLPDPARLATSVAYDSLLRGHPQIGAYFRAEVVAVPGGHPAADAMAALGEARSRVTLLQGKTENGVWELPGYLQERTGANDANRDIYGARGWSIAPRFRYLKQNVPGAMQSLEIQEQIASALTTDAWDKLIPMSGIDEATGRGKVVKGIPIAGVDFTDEDTRKAFTQRYATQLAKVQFWTFPSRRQMANEAITWAWVRRVQQNAARGRGASRFTTEENDRQGQDFRKYWSEPYDKTYREAVRVDTVKRAHAILSKEYANASQHWPRPAAAPIQIPGPSLQIPGPSLQIPGPSLRMPGPMMEKQQGWLPSVSPDAVDALFGPFDRPAAMRKNAQQPGFKVPPNPVEAAPEIVPPMDDAPMDAADPPMDAADPPMDAADPPMDAPMGGATPPATTPPATTPPVATPPATTPPATTPPASRNSNSASRLRPEYEDNDPLARPLGADLPDWMSYGEVTKDAFDNLMIAPDSADTWAKLEAHREKLTTYLAQEDAESSGLQPGVREDAARELARIHIIQQAKDLRETNPNTPIYPQNVAAMADKFVSRLEEAESQGEREITNEEVLKLGQMNGEIGLMLGQSPNTGAFGQVKDFLQDRSPFELGLLMVGVPLAIVGLFGAMSGEGGFGSFLALLLGGAATAAGLGAFGRFKQTAPAIPSATAAGGRPGAQAFQGAGIRGTVAHWDAGDRDSAMDMLEEKLNTNPAYEAQLRKAMNQLHREGKPQGSFWGGAEEAGRSVLDFIGYTDNELRQSAAKQGVTVAQLKKLVFIYKSMVERRAARQKTNVGKPPKQL